MTIAEMISDLADYMVEYGDRDVRLNWGAGDTLIPSGCIVMVEPENDEPYALIELDEDAY